MELNIDTGVEEFRVNGRGVLRFNPADPNLYHRFFAAGAELDGYDAALTKALAALDGEKPVCGVLQQADSAFLRRVAAHPRVRVVTVTEENRDALRQRLCIEK